MLNVHQIAEAADFWRDAAMHYKNKLEATQQELRETLEVLDCTGEG